MASDDSGRGATPGSDRKKAKVVMAADIDEDELFEPKLHGYGYEYRIRGYAISEKTLIRGYG